MLGAVFGDIVGSAYEWNNVKTKHFPLETPITKFTDDSVMTLAVAKWLMEDVAHTEKGLIKIMQQMGNAYPRAGYGGRFRRWLKSPDPQPYNSWGNGSAMRVSPVGLYSASLEEALELAEITANVTHNHPEGVKGALAVAECVYICRKSKNLETAKERIKRNIPKKYGYNLDRTLDEIRPTYSFDVSCQGSVPEAIIAFLESDSLLDCVQNAISIGGDSDTIAAIACSIFAANEEFVDVGVTIRFAKYLTPELRGIMQRFECMVSHKKPIVNSYKVLDRVYAGEYPIDYDEEDNVNKIMQFERFGITHFIDLTEEGELRPYEQMLSSDVQYTRFPIRDVSVPKSMESVKELMTKIFDILKENERNNIYIHCHGGVGRTGTIVGCLLTFKYRCKIERTMIALKEAFSDYPKSVYMNSPETSEQRMFIEKFAKEMSTK